MKKLLSVLLAALMVFGAAESAFAVSVILNSSYLKFPDQEPVIENGVTLIPIRAVSEALGLTVTWDDNTDMVRLENGSFYAELAIGNTVANTSSGKKTLPAPPKIINGRTMVPLRFIAEAMGLTVLWNDEYQRVVINGAINTSATVAAATEKTGETNADETQSSASDGNDSLEDATDEEEPQADEGAGILIVAAQSSSVIFDMPLGFEAENTDDEASFAYRAVDAVDFQHLYNWDIVSNYEGYADSDGKNGIVIITEEYEPSEDTDVDVSRINEARPEPPAWPDVDMREAQRELKYAAYSAMFEDKGVEMPEDILDMEDGEVVELLGYDDPETFTSDLQQYMQSIDMSEIPGYDEYFAWQEESREYNETVRELDGIKNAAKRNFSSLYSQTGDEEWSKFFDSQLNTDQEVRYENVEILTVNDKPVIHATIYAEDPDDEQGTFEYYLYYDGDVRVTILGGTLDSSSPSPEAADALSQMRIN